MRLFFQLALLAILVSATPARSQEWLDYVNREYRFSINFPAQPRHVEETYNAANGAMLSAHRFAAERDGGQYAVTVVVFPSLDFDRSAEMEHAVDQLRPLGEIRYEGATDYDDIPVYELNMVAPNGNQIMATAILFGEFLYLVEAEVGAAMAPPVHFQQSVSPLDADGHAVLQ
jgi:hypothetical protein